MVRVSEFHGIVVEMFHNDHAPPHFHARYAEQKVVVAIDPVRVLGGRLPRREERLVLQWTRLHRDELMENWRRARAFGPVTRIAPLD